MILIPRTLVRLSESLPAPLSGAVAVVIDSTPHGTYATVQVHGMAPFDVDVLDIVERDSGRVPNVY